MKYADFLSNPMSIAKVIGKPEQSGQIQYVKLVEPISYTGAA
jgi:hypothetical protein